MSFLGRLLRPKARPYNEEINPVENDPVGLIVGKREAASGLENHPVEQLNRMPAAVDQPPLSEAPVPALKPEPEAAKKAEQPDDPLLALLKVNQETVAEKRRVALDEGSENRPVDETYVAGQKPAATNINQGMASPPLRPEMPAPALVPAPPERAVESTDHNIPVDSNKETDAGETAVQTAVVPVSDPAPAGADTVSLPAPAVEKAQPGPKADGAGILDIFREEIGDESRTIAVPLAQIDIQVLLQEGMHIRNILNRRCRA